MTDLEEKSRPGQVAAGAKITGLEDAMPELQAAAANTTRDSYSSEPVRDSITSDTTACTEATPSSASLASEKTRGRVTRRPARTEKSSPSSGNAPTGLVSDVGKHRHRRKKVDGTTLSGEQNEPDDNYAFIDGEEEVAAFAPGAQAVPGPDASIFKRISSPQEDSTILQESALEDIAEQDNFAPVEAELVTMTSQRGQLEAVRQEARKELLQNATEAEIVAEPTWWEKNWHGMLYCCICISVCLVLGFALLIILLVVFVEDEAVPVPDFTDDSFAKNDQSCPLEPAGRLNCLLDSMLAGNNETEQDASFQRAVEWMIVDDPYPILDDPNSDSWKIVERFTLVLLHFATRGEQWYHSFNFLSNSSVCEWSFDNEHGVVCTEEGKAKPPGRVAFIDLHLNNLNGTIPTLVGKLNYLQHFALKGNELSGTIPSEMGGLSILTNLDLSYNRLSGSIPPLYGRLGHENGELSIATSRMDIRLSHNALTGSIPSPITYIPNLYELDLRCNVLDLVEEDNSHHFDDYCKNGYLELLLDCTTDAGMGCSCCSCNDPSSC